MKKIRPISLAPKLRNVLLNISRIQNNYSLFFYSFPADMQISICGTLAALAFEIHLADAPGEAEADIT